MTDGNPSQKPEVTDAGGFQFTVRHVPGTSIGGEE